MNPLLLLRLARLARRRPSPRLLAVVLGVLALVAALAAVEAIWGWPEALTPDRAGTRPRLP